MPQSFLRFSLITLGMGLLLALLHPTTGLAASGDDVLPGIVVVGFHEGTAPDGSAKTGRTVFDAAAARHDVYAVEKAFPEYDGPAAKRVRTPSGEALQRVYYVRFSGPQPPEQVAEALAQDPHVAFAEPYFVRRLAGEATAVATPNDPQFDQMTHLPHLNLPEAWDVVKGEQGDVIIAIVDGGTDWQHPDLQANIWTNPGEIDGNGIDDDGNGHIDDVHGWNFINAQSGEIGQNGSPDPSSPSLPQNLNHGTVVAGAAGAVTNNGTGVAGSSWNATIMPIGASCPSNDNSICFGYAGLRYAAQNGADIINASWGGENYSDFEALLIDEAYELGAMVVAAAGNSDTDNDRAPFYPASYERVLAVGGTRKAEDANLFNYGMSVDVFASGQGVNSTLPNEQYSTFNSGTSFASPLVAGIAGLVKTQFPNLTPDQLREMLRVTADPIDAANPSRVGKMGRGRANALRAVTETNHPAIRLTNLLVADSGSDGEIESGETVTLTATLTNYLADASNVSVALETDNAFITTGPLASIGSLPSGASETVTLTFEMAANTPDNLFLLLNTAVTAGSYTDADVIRLVANETAVATHASNELQVSITNEGNIGFIEFADESAGIGFRRAGGPNLLFEGGLIVATGPGQVSDAVRGTASDPGNQHMDFMLEPGTALEIINPGEITSEQGRVELVDTPAPNPIGLSILQDSYINQTPAHEQFVIFQYTLENISDESLSDIHVGLFFDWDLSPNGQNDIAGFDEEHQVGYMEDGSATFVGLKLLSDASLSYRSIDNPQEIYRDQTGGGFTEAEKWSFISSGIQRTALSQTDISQVIGAGPFLIDPGATATAAFAVILGDDLNSLLQRAQAAQSLWDTIIAPREVHTEEPLPSPGTFALDPVYPNPLTGTATLGYHLGEPSDVTLTIYDVLGRAVHTLAAGRQHAGAHTASWNGRDRAGRPVAGGLYLVRLTAQSPTTTFTDHQQVVVLR